jgi:hypothetical protein
MAYYLPESGALAHDGCMRCQRGDVLTNKDKSTEEVGQTLAAVVQSSLLRNRCFCFATSFTA